MIQKIMEKSPLKYNFAKSISCLDPTLIKTDFELAGMRLNKCLEELVEKKWISGVKADAVKEQYMAVFSSHDVKEQSKLFKRGLQRLDVFFMNIISIHENDCKELTVFVKLILSLSHGNASVERGFSVNKECVVENLHEESLIALRQIYDGVTSVGGLEKVVISKELSARNAHARYTERLKERREELTNEEKEERKQKQAALEQKKLEAEKAEVLASARKRAAEIEEKIGQLKKKK